MSQLVVCLLALGSSALAQTPAQVAGTVHDAAGQPQIGVLVQLLSPDNVVLASVFTDKDGHYALASATAGIFEVKATASTFLPTVRRNIPLNLGADTLLNLTLSTVTEAMQWLPAKPRTPADPADDWQWTLRSPVNRPILREFDPGIVLTSASNDKPGRSLHDVQASAQVETHSAAFATSGVHQVLTLDRVNWQRHDYYFQADVTPSGSQSASAVVATTYQEGPGSEVHMAGNYQWHSGLQAGLPDGSLSFGAQDMGVGTLRIAQASQMGPQITVEAGNEIQQIGWAGHVTQVHPFADMTVRPTESTTLAYTISTAPGFASAADADRAGEAAPMVAPSARGLQIEHGIHQQLRWARDTGTTVVAAAFFHDLVEDPLLEGTATASAFDSANLPAGYDPASGLLREAVNGYSTQGIELSVDHDFGSLAATLSVMDADALALAGNHLQATPATRTENAQLAQLALRGQIADTGTRWRVAYGAESHGVIVPLSVFGGLGNGPGGQGEGPQPFLNVALRQPLHLSHLEAVVEVRNLLAEGYHPFVTPDGETILFMQVPRTLQAGLVFSF